MRCGKIGNLDTCTLPVIPYISNCPEKGADVFVQQSPLRACIARIRNFRFWLVINMGCIGSKEKSANTAAAVRKRHFFGSVDSANRLFPVLSPP